MLKLFFFKTNLLSVKSYQNNNSLQVSNLMKQVTFWDANILWNSKSKGMWSVCSLLKAIVFEQRANIQHMSTFTAYTSSVDRWWVCLTSSSSSTTSSLLMADGSDFTFFSDNRACFLATINLSTEHSTTLQVAIVQQLIHNINIPPVLCSGLSLRSWSLWQHKQSY